MLAFDKGQYRQVTGFIRQQLNPRNVQGLTTSGSIDDELWVLLEYYSEINEVGLKFIQNNGVKNQAARNSTYKHFQAYIRQAKNYYYSAKQLAPRSAGLLYYYSFLNLAKAALVIKDPKIGGKRIGHGISYKIDGSTDFSRQTVKVLSYGVFPKLYYWYFRQPIKQTSLSIPILLNYCTDIEYQCQIAGINKTKILNSYYTECVDKNKKTTWGLLAVPKANTLLIYPKSTKRLLETFEKVELTQQSCRTLFEMDALEQANYTFLQSKRETKWITDNTPNSFEVRSDTLDALINVFQTYYFDEGANFVIALPYLPHKQVRIDEAISIYLIMFYLSNLVRYNPQFIEGLLNKKEAWLVDSFVKFCSVTFLRMIISRIIGTDYILARR